MFSICKVFYMLVVPVLQVLTVARTMIALKPFFSIIMRFEKTIEGCFLPLGAISMEVVNKFL